MSRTIRSFIDSDRLSVELALNHQHNDFSGYDADGRTTFNALGIISYNVATKSYSMRSYAMGQTGDFPVMLTSDGFAWEIPAGPATIRYQAIDDEAMVAHHCDIAVRAVIRFVIS